MEKLKVLDKLQNMLRADVDPEAWQWKLFSSCTGVLCPDEYVETMASIFVAQYLRSKILKKRD